MRAAVAGLAAVALVLVGCSTDDSPSSLDVRRGDSAAAQDAPAEQVPGPRSGPPQATAPSPSVAATPTTPLLQPAAHGDGDSWRDTAGTEYRLGLVNAPEHDECFGPEATAERRRLVATGFRADVYTIDRYGRGVSVVHTADGVNLNVDLARRGFVDDRYLAEFRSENPELGVALDAAFAEARASGRGLWSACAVGAEAAAPPVPAAAPVPVAAPAAVGGCHPDYLTCIPVAGNGSGSGRGNDLDCGVVEGPVQARSRGTDPYRLDADGDGIGCDS